MNGSFEFLLGLAALRPCALEWTDVSPQAAYEMAFLDN
jgi:hypothetical protein